MFKDTNGSNHSFLKKLKTYPISVLLVDDQPFIAEAIRQMLAGEDNMVFNYCSDPSNAIQVANTVLPTVILQRPCHARRRWTDSFTLL